MDVLATMLQERTPQMIAGLTAQAGLSAAEAVRFVPEAAQATVAALQKPGTLNVGELLEGGDVGSLLGRLDVSALAGKVGITEAQATSALRTVVPDVLGWLKSKGGGVEGVLSLLRAQGGKALLPDPHELGKQLFGG